MRPHIKRPTAEEISAVVSASTDTEFVELHKPTYDYLRANLPNDDAVSAYVSNRITSELVRLSKMPDGTGGRPHKAPPTERQREANRTNANARWAGREKVSRVKVRVYDEPHGAYMDCAPKKQARTETAGACILAGLGALDRTALLSYCESHKAKPQKFVTLPEEAVNRTKDLADEIGVPFTKIVCYLLSEMR